MNYGTTNTRTTRAAAARTSLPIVALLALAGIAAVVRPALISTLSLASKWESGDLIHPEGASDWDVDMAINLLKGGEKPKMPPAEDRPLCGAGGGAGVIKGSGDFALLAYANNAATLVACHDVAAQVRCLSGLTGCTPCTNSV